MNPDTMKQVAQEVQSVLPAFLLTLPGLLLISLLGMITHFMVKKVKGETATAILDYFKDHFKSTVVAIIVTIIATVGLYAGFATGQPMDIIAIFTVGLSCDSIINRWEAKANPEEGNDDTKTQ